MELLKNTIYHCRRTKEQKSIAQLVKLDNDKIIFKYMDGLFSVCNLSEVLPVYGFRYIELMSTAQNKELKDFIIVEESVDDMVIDAGVYKVSFKESYTMYFIVFNDRGAVIYVPNTEAIVFWKDAKHMIQHIITNSLLWIP